jgi:hypothetical protein
VPAAYLKYHVTALVCQATGGPCQYHGRAMRDSHAHLAITEREWERMVLGSWTGRRPPRCDRARSPSSSRWRAPGDSGSGSCDSRCTTASSEIGPDRP